MLDYDKIGLKCGVEIHQQLEGGKLFCKCSVKNEEPKEEIRRKLRAVAGELGEIDRAALHEVLRGKEFIYKVYPCSSCLVEMDCEPPHLMNVEALEAGLVVSTMLNCDIPDEIHVMRKQVIDGSNTTGFQRTAIIGIDGFLQTKSGKVGITNVCVEEEACQIIEAGEKSVTYGLDRLSIPLVEIGTSPEIKTPEQAREVCESIGMLLRSTGKVKRGIGTIRQDINISIKNGARVEIKGAQELRLIPKLVENEVLRQLSLIEIMRELKEIGFQKIECHGIDVTHIFGNAQSNITRGKETYAIKVPKMGGFLKRKLTPTRTLGNEIANYVRVKSGLKGIIHSDEDVEKYNLGKEFRELAEFIKAGKEDLLAIVSGDVKSCKSAIEAFARRVNQLVDGIPEETRKALDSGDTEYMRPLPGSARMYPETDIPPIPVERRLLDKIMKNPPELIEHKIARFVRQYKIPEELARQVVNSGFDFVFEKAAKTIMEPVLVANTLTSTLTYLRREGIPVERLSENHLMEIFRALEEGKFSKEKLPDVLKVQAEHPEIGMEKVLEKAGAGSLSIDELRKIVRDTISSNRQVFSLPNPEKALMGLVMEKVRGKIPGKIVADVLREEIKR